MDSLNVSFQGRVPVNLRQLVKNAPAERIAANINDAFHSQGIKHLRPVSGKSLIEKNPDCFDKRTHLLNEEGKKCFNNVNKTLGVSADSPMRDYLSGIVTYVQKFVDEGNVNRFFDIFK